MITLSVILAFVLGVISTVLYLNKRFVNVKALLEDKEYKIGQKVLFHDLAGIEFTHKDETIFSLRERDITAIILDKNVQIW